MRLKAPTTTLSIIPLFIIVLLNEISYQMVIPTMTQVVSLTVPQAGETLTNTLVGGGIAAFTIAVIAGSPLVGFLSDRFGRKLLLTGCLFLGVLSSALFIFSLYFHHIIYFFIARFLSGIAGASTAIVQATIADTSIQRQRSVHFSTVGLALTIGLIIGPLLGGWFVKGTATVQALVLPFILTAVLFLLNIFLFLKLFQETAHLSSDAENLAFRFISKKTGIFLSQMFLLELSWSLYFLVLPVYLSHHFLYDSRHIGFFMSTAGIVMCFGLLAYSTISQYLNNLKITVLSFIIFMLSLGILIFIHNLILNWIMLLPITWSVALSYVAITGLVSESAKQEHQGTLMGTLLTLMALAWTLTGFSAKFLFSFSADLPFIISIAGLGVGLLLLKNPPHK